ncbi:SH3-like domain-containing protein [Chitinivorax tropicus]|uniref:SH3-like domain-containing protein n=1 Tax=Chitinivorax tropicus TaxID=714531 RepID=A0A840MN49_9PROT|nr:SH3 domain-containing protein [Chitinivorax tropicus]MBB5018172.1 SH3-like domain-containing protein [Chitinivorax tropicus]
MNSKHLLLLTKLLLSWLPACLPAAASALDFQSVAPGVAILRTAPSVQAKPIFVLSRATPLEVMLLDGDWAKVRDRDGTMGWLERKRLSTRSMVVVNLKRTVVRAKADESASVLFEVEKDVLLEALERPNSGWVKVRLQNGPVGFIRLNEIWGM